MKTLYISDLDGTLLDKNAEVSEYTITAINQLIDNGMNFSVATARTSATALYILKDLHLNTPIILMNGVCIYDPLAGKMIKTEIIPITSVHNVIAILKQYKQTGFLYGLIANRLDTYYENIDSPHRKAFYEERVSKYQKRFTKVESFSDIAHKDIVYFSICEKEELITPIYHELKNDTEIRIEFYHDIYAEGYCYLEVCSKSASKYNAVQFLREKCSFDNVVCFGDNLNDIPMFKASNLRIAVGNAKEDVKQESDIVIDKNTDDGVAKWLLKMVR